MVKATTPEKTSLSAPVLSERGLRRKRRIQQIEKSTLNTIGTAIHNVAAIRDYHRLDSDKADDQFELERKLSEIESKLALALDAALKTGIADLQHHARLCELVSLLRMRVPAMKQAIERTSEAFVRSRALIMERQGALPQPPKGLEALLKIDNLRIDISNWVCLQHMFQLAADKDILSILLSMRPVLFSAPPGEEFVTSDQPVALFSPEVRPTDHYGAALAAKSTELSLPLSSDKTFSGYPGNRIPKSRE